MINDKAEDKTGGVSEEKIIENLSRISSKLKKLKNRGEKIQTLVELNDYLKVNGDIIEKVCPEKLVSILNSL